MTELAIASRKTSRKFIQVTANERKTKGGWFAVLWVAAAAAAAARPSQAKKARASVNFQLKVDFL